MKKIIAACLILGMLVLPIASVSAAGEGKGTGDQLRTQDKLKDGSFLLETDTSVETVAVSGDQIRLHDRLHDQIRDKLQDGSCQLL